MKRILLLFLIFMYIGCSDLPPITENGEELNSNQIPKSVNFSKSVKTPTPKPISSKTKITTKSFLQSENNKISVNRQKCDQADYKLGPGDKIIVVVTGQNDYRLMKDYEVGLDGTLIFDFIGEVEAKGKTTIQLGSEIQSKLGENFLVNPRVKISVKKFFSHKVYISGEVNKPGEFLLKKECQWLSGVLMEAGGLLGNFNKNAFITSGSLQNSKSPSIKMVDLYQVFIAGNHSNDVLIYNNDIIQVFDKGVNPLGPQNSIFIFGEVIHSGMFPYSADLTVLSAILIRGGGFSKTAKKSKTVVKRIINDEVKSFIINLDDVIQGKKDLDIKLKPGDIIIVPRKFF